MPSGVVVDAEAQHVVRVELVAQSPDRRQVGRVDGRPGAATPLVAVEEVDVACGRSGGRPAPP